ncbi:MAG: tRNA dihydrouridine synthase DusB [Clostridiales bacterium GWF2_38_85]|nr:MAG: tRNA dihydrouridine synthase DusB [Clostridiales bacterium GWF2_38_85]HBL85452.1 tRNA dihydrouridine synthase DusB [Clostridiales bacterium]
MDFKKDKTPILYMAPMAGVTDRAFRRLCLECGAKIVVTEMVSAKAVQYGDKKSYELGKLFESDQPAIIQIFGSDPIAMAFAAKEMTAFNPIAIDINMGCPVPKVSGSGDGASLMKNPRLAGEIINAVVSAIDVPVTVKIRSGWDSKNINAVEIALIAEANGAAVVTVHGRTKVQGYEGYADRNVIKEVKQTLKIPVIANGDIVDGASAIDMLEKTDCDGLMVGRGALGSPWVFTEIKAVLENKPYIPYSPGQKREMILRQLDMMVIDKGEQLALLEIRKHIAWYIKGIPNAASIRASVFLTHTKEKLIEIIKNIDFL